MLGSFNIWSLTDDSSSNITRLQILMSMVCQELVFWLEERKEIGKESSCPSVAVLI